MAAAAAGQVKFGCITFLSDYGLNDEFVAVCKGVIRGIAPRVEILDISHCVEPFGLRQASGVLARAVVHMPAAVHLAIVDPTVGSSRRPVVIRSRAGPVFVGPDNGLLPAAADACGGPEAAWELANPDLQLPLSSSTFHGRDIFAPAAAHAAEGRPLEDFGAEVAPGSLVRLVEPLMVNHGDHLECEVVSVDWFGNVQLSVRGDELARSLGVRPGESLLVEAPLQRSRLPWRDHFAAVEAGAGVLITDSSGHAALAINQGSFAGASGSKVGDRVVLARVDGGGQGHDTQ